MAMYVDIISIVRLWFQPEKAMDRGSIDLARSYSRWGQANMVEACMLTEEPQDMGLSSSSRTR